MKFPVLWSGLCCCTVKCSKILAHIKLLYNPRVNKVFTSLHNPRVNKVFTSLHFTTHADFFALLLFLTHNSNERLKPSLQHAMLNYKEKLHS